MSKQPPDPMDEKLAVLNEVRKVQPRFGAQGDGDRLRRPSEYRDYLIEHWDDITEENCRIPPDDDKS